MYTTMGTFMALELYMFLCSIVHQIIEACTDIPLGWSLAIIVGVPVAIVVFGLIWVSIIHIDEITLNPQESDTVWTAIYAALQQIGKR